MAHRNFSLQKKYCKFNTCCTCCYWGIAYIFLLSPLNRSVRHHFIMFRMYIIRTSWEHNQQKGSVASVNRAGGSEPFRRGFRGWSPMRKFLGSKEYLDWFNTTGKTVLLNSVQEFIEIQVWLLMTFFLRFHNQFISIYYIVT